MTTQPTVRSFRPTPIRAPRGHLFFARDDPSGEGPGPRRAGHRPRAHPHRPRDRRAGGGHGRARARRHPDARACPSPSASRQRSQAIGGQAVPVGALDITLYRDDLGLKAEQPRCCGHRHPLPGARGRIVVLVDDVLYTGRTIRAALDAIIDLGRPRIIRWPSWSTAAIASCPSGRTTSARTCRRRAARPCQSCSASTMGRTAS